MGRPRVHLNCAVSHDGRLAAADGSPVRYSDEGDLRRVHELRAECDAILVGIGTVLADDPKLTVKPELAEGSNPLRVVLDRHGRIPLDAAVLNAKAPTVILTNHDAAPIPGATQLRVKDTPSGLSLDGVLDALAGLGIRSVMVEGGEAVLRSFLAADAWDAFTVFRAESVQGGEGPRLWDANPQELELRFEAQPAGAGTLLTFSRE